MATPYSAPDPVGPVLGIETSCDETGLAIYHPDRGIVAEQLHSQVAIHTRYGGVVPELASRDHVRRLVPLLSAVLEQANLSARDLAGIAYTAGPGLLGALLVGATFGRTLAWRLNVPAVGVHHMEAHLLAPLLADQAIAYPFVALLVSGGHTQLVHVAAPGRYEILGESVDDAAGEAFDKVAKMLDLGYPGGPEVARLANRGDPNRFDFPRPMTGKPGLDFSFSGLKTFTMNTLAGIPEPSDQDRADIARAFEEAVVDTLVIKCRRAIRHTGCAHLVMAGGVAANMRLRIALADRLDVDVHYPPASLCTDNGAMIAYAGALRLAAGERSDLAITTRARWPLNELEPLLDRKDVDRKDGGKAGRKAS